MSKADGTDTTGATWPGRGAALAGLVCGVLHPVAWIALHPRLEAATLERVDQVAAYQWWGVVHLAIFLSYVLIAFAAHAWSRSVLPAPRESMLPAVILVSLAVATVAILMDGVALKLAADEAREGIGGPGAGVAVNAVNEATFAAGVLWLFGAVPGTLCWLLRRAGVSAPWWGSLLAGASLAAVFGVLVFFMPVTQPLFAVFLLGSLPFTTCLAVAGWRALARGSFPGRPLV